MFSIFSMLYITCLVHIYPTRGSFCFLTFDVLFISPTHHLLQPQIWSFLCIYFFLMSENIFILPSFFKNLYWICYNIASVLCFGFLAMRACGILPPQRDQTHTSCIVRWSLSYLTAREVPEHWFCIMCLKTVGGAWFPKASIS